MTVRQALASLAARGLVERGVGRGTFVGGAAEGRARPVGRVAGFTERSSARASRPAPRSSPPGEHAAPQPSRRGARASTPGAPVVRLERVRSGDGLAVALEDAWLPAERFPGLLGHDLSGSLYALMRDVLRARAR